jgi:translocon-associated protein subunit alpha
MLRSNSSFLKHDLGFFCLFAELHAGKVVEFLVGFTNKGKDTFTLESLDASFRYPQDYSFHIQNFTAAPYNRPVKPKEQVTLSYTFYTDESFAGRPFGLVVSLGYRDSVRILIK